MKQLSEDYGQGGESVASLFRKTALAKLPAVREYLTDVLDRGDDKFIVFAHHRDMMDEIEQALQPRLAAQHLSLVRIDGGVQVSKRADLVKKFQEDDSCRVALLSITACAEGITLTAAALVIFAELYWVPGVVEQAEARAHRIGSAHEKVVVEFLVAPGSPDEAIYKSLCRKKLDTSNVLDGAKEALGAVERELKRPRRGVFESRREPGAAKAAPAGVEAAALAAAETVTVEERARIRMLLKAARH